MATIRRLGDCAVATVTGLAALAAARGGESPALNSVEHMQDYRVIELRRYAIKPHEREHFARYFEALFPGAFQQLGAIAFGEGFERDNTTWFTWLRGFKDMDARVSVNTAFYYGPLWKEHRQTLNDLMLDSDNVLLLRPLDAEHGVSVLPALDVVKEPDGAQGIVALQIYAVEASQSETFAQHAAHAFDSLRRPGIREAGRLVTLDVPNNFPQLPVRSDGPFLVWLGIIQDAEVLERQYSPAAAEVARSLTATGMLRGKPELVVIDPARCSRLRWLSYWRQ
jgi:hypothetical protein